MTAEKCPDCGRPFATNLRGRRFPVLDGGMTVPWHLLAPHEPQAMTNHGQTLERLAQRGGLSWAELNCVLDGRRWNHGRELSDEAAKPLVLTKLGLLPNPPKASET